MMNYELKKRSVNIRFIQMIRFATLLGILQMWSVSYSQQKQEAFIITNYVTEHYRDFPMMKISIIPPAGFLKDPDQVGFLDSKDAAAIRAEHIKQGVQKAAVDFFKRFDSTSHKDSLGIKLVELYDFRINGFEAHLVGTSGTLEGEDYLQWLLFIGDASDTYILKGFLPTSKKKTLEQQVRSALLSVFYEPERRLIPVGADPTTTGTSSCNCQTKK